MFHSLSRDVGPRAALVVGEVGLPVGASFCGTIETMQKFGFVEVGVGVVGVRLERDVKGVEGGLRLA